MKTAHPGCGGHAGSKGYNSGGHYCGGWAGNCGDGGVGGSSWYGFCVLNFLSILSNFLSPEKLSNCAKPQFSVYFLLFPYPKNFSQFFSSHWKK